MKKSQGFSILALAGCLCLFTAACSSTSRPAATDTEPASPAAPLAEFVEEVPLTVATITRSASTKLMTELKSHLQQAMKAGGAAEAVSFCSGQAIPLTEQVAAGFPEDISIKRATLKPRNAVNRADQWETEAIHDLQSFLDQGQELPPFRYQMIRDGDTVTYRGYVPIVMGAPCLGCHGDENAMKPELLDQIRKLYPEGNATGYTKGDLRGGIRVEIRP